MILGSLCNDLRVYFKTGYVPKLSLGRKVMIGWCIQMVSFYKTLGAVCEDLRVFFKLSFIPHLGLGRKVVPVYLINPVPKTKVPAAVASVLTQNVWVTVLDAVGSVCVDTIMFQQEVAGETLEVHIVDMFNYIGLNVNMNCVIL